MSQFAALERTALQALRDATVTVRLRQGAENERAADILVQLAEGLRLSEPVRVAVLGTDHGAVAYQCATPIGAHILSLAAANDESGSLMQQQVIEHECKQLASFPERLANVVAESHATVFLFDAPLFWERVCDTVLLFLFTKARQRGQDAAGVRVGRAQLLCVLRTLTVDLLRRGKTATLLERLFLLPRDLFDGPQFCESLHFLTEAAFHASSQLRFSLHARNRADVTNAWYQWNSQLLRLAERRPETKSSVFAALSAQMQNAASDLASSLARYLFDAIFIHELTVAIPSRPVARSIIKDLLPLSAGVLSEENGEFTDREQRCLDAIFRKWDDKEFVISGELGGNFRLLHPVMYALLYIHEKSRASDGFPDAFTGPLLNGVSIRLDSTRGPEMRNAGMAVAAAFAMLFVKSADGVAPLLQEASFSAALNAWMKEESGASPYASVVGSAPQAKKPAKAAGEEKQRVSAQIASFSLDPDEAYSFFSAPSLSVENAAAVTKTSANSALAQSHLDPEHAPLPSFGQQKYAKDELDDQVSILGSIRACYNALVGVGRSPNAQLHEVQEAAESGLRGLADAFANLRCQIGSDLFTAVGKEVGPLIPTLLPVLISLSIYAPEEQKQHLLELRYQNLVDLIVLNPTISLSQLSGMVYRSTYGIYQRTELIKAIGEAASVLSQVEVKASAVDLGSDSAPRSGGVVQSRRIYPPIPMHHLSEKGKRAIVVVEGQRTRRWGSAVVERQNRAAPKRYKNLLGEVAAAFVAVFLSKLDADHFAFFQDVDPYSSCAILDALTTVFQGITNVRHIAGDLCERNFEFFFAVCTQHPNLTVKKAAWACVVEVMRTWCGVAPLWIRRKDGERVLNRGATAAGRSLAFTEAWLKGLEILQHACELLVQRNDACGRTALIAVSTLRDLVCDRDDFQSMLARVEEQVVGD